MIALFEIEFEEEWDKYFKKIEKAKIWKKIQQLKTKQKARHLKHDLSFFVLETGQHRICFKEQKNSRIIYFAGNHKQYEKWFKKQ